MNTFIKTEKPFHDLISSNDYIVRQATVDDLSAIQELLIVSGLPTAEVAANVSNFIVADNGKIIGVIGAHYCGTKVLLRSFAVSFERQKSGVGWTLLQEMQKKFNSKTVAAVYLLTNTAQEYFKRVGFYEISYSEIPALLLSESGLDKACPCTSQCMKFLL